MSLFGGVDLGTAAQRNEAVVRKELETRRKRWSDPTTLYRGHGDYLLRHGQFYLGCLLPDQYLPLQGEEGSCFWNAIAACEADPTLRYCEGVYSHGQGSFVAHAWCLAPDDTVLEVTFPTHNWENATNVRTGLDWMSPATWAYWGVVFDRRLAQAHSDAQGMPMLGRGPNEGMSLPERWPLLTVPYDRTRVDLP